ncbi:MAG: hypothetical protein IJE09_02075, partial [Oscillospiraceae bacterium]|nr:hypothetical protein [Oscillospiraceae bacterium]
RCIAVLPKDIRDKIAEINNSLALSCARELFLHYFRLPRKGRGNSNNLYFCKAKISLILDMYGGNFLCVF